MSDWRPETQRIAALAEEMAAQIVASLGGNKAAAEKSRAMRDAFYRALDEVVRRTTQQQENSRE
jgi:hypothetical protein